MRRIDRPYADRSPLLAALIAAVAILASTTSSLAVQDDEQPEANPEAAKAFEEMVKHYRELPGVEVKCTMTITMQQDGAEVEGEPVDARILRNRNGDGVFELRGFTVTSLKNALWIVHESTDHSYYTEPFQDSPYWVLLTRFQDLPFPHLGILWGDEEIPFVWAELHSKSTELVPAKVEDVAKDDGSHEKLITLRGPNASLVLHENAETKLIDAAEHEITGGIYVRDGAVIRTKYKFEHVVYDNDADVPAITFEPAGRQRVDFIASLIDVPPPAALAGGDDIDAAPAPGEAIEGQQAPAFELPLLAGGSVKLEKQRGQVVVLDFWATWCPPCRAALPKLHEVGAWAKREELPVRIFAVNLREKPEIVQPFWSGNKYSLPVALDSDGAVANAYAVQSIPTTVVIRSDGVVHAYHVGAPQEYADWLKSEIKDALAALEGKDAPAAEH